MKIRHWVQQTDKLLNTVGTKHFQTNRIYIYLQKRLSKMILTTFAVCSSH